MEKDTHKKIQLHPMPRRRGPARLAKEVRARIRTHVRLGQSVIPWLMLPQATSKQKSSLHQPATMASSWSNKLETRLSTLADGASAESIQSLAQWIGFNRKHSKAFCTTLNKHFQQDSAARQCIYLQIVHGVLLLEKDNPTKWDRLSDTRSLLGESVVLPALQRSNNAAMKECVAPMIDEWDDVNAFGTPTLVNRMRKLLSSEVKEEEATVDSKPADADVKPPKEEPKSEPVQEVKDAAVKQEEDVKMKEEQETPDMTPSKLSLKRASSVEEVTFDFEGSVSTRLVSSSTWFRHFLTFPPTFIFHFHRAFLIQK